MIQIENFTVILTQLFCSVMQFVWPGNCPLPITDHSAGATGILYVLYYTLTGRSASFTFIKRINRNMLYFKLRALILAPVVGW